jgi:hypothetical protein
MKNRIQAISKSAPPKAGGRRLLPGLSVKDGYMQHPFDLEFGVRTSGLVAGRSLKTGHPHDRHNTAYYGVAPSVLRLLTRRWLASKPCAPIEEFTFIDFGAGMGRGVLLAAEMPFYEVVGVELHPVLAKIAEKNILCWQDAGRAMAPMRILCADAVEFAFPRTPCVAFLFNPFSAAVLRRLLKSIAASFAERSGQLDLLYVNDEHQSVLQQHAGFKRIYSGKIPRSRKDAIADHRILANQPDGEYASANYEDCCIYRWVGRKLTNA